MAYIESNRKKALELMQKGIVTYRLVYGGWQVSDHLGDGYDLIALKGEHVAKVELKAIDLSAIKEGNNATQHLSVNEIVSSTHLIITIFDKIILKANYIMTIRQYLEHNKSEKYLQYDNFEQFLNEYKKQAGRKASRRKGHANAPRFDIDFSFNPKKLNDWKLARFKNQWKNLEIKNRKSL